MNLGIITFQFAINYGAALQAYALQKYLIGKGDRCDVINYLPEDHVNKYKVRAKISRSIKSKRLKEILKLVRYFIFDYKEYKTKSKKFHDFVDKNIELSEETYFCNSIISVYDCIICGSDQIWNPEITGGFDPMYFGTNGTVKKISYAASVGDLNSLDNSNDKNIFLQLVQKMDCIGVREQSLKQYLQSNGIFNVSVVCDPVFLINKDDYLSLIKPVEFSNYLLIYQLERYSHTYDIAKKIAKERNLQIIELCGTPIGRFHDSKVICDASPTEFLSLIYYSDFIVTNSFHGTAFSLIFNKQFYCTLSRQRNERILDLLSAVRLEDRIVDSNNTPASDIINYDLVNITLQGIKNQSEEYLERAVHSVE